MGNCLKFLAISFQSPKAEEINQFEPIIEEMPAEELQKLSDSSINSLEVSKAQAEIFSAKDSPNTENNKEANSNEKNEKNFCRIDVDFQGEDSKKLKNEEDSNKNIEIQKNVQIVSENKGEDNNEKYTDLIENNEQSTKIQTDSHILSENLEFHKEIINEKNEKSDFNTFFNFLSIYFFRN